MCCSVLQSVSQCVAVCILYTSTLTQSRATPCVAVCRSMLQSVVESILGTSTLTQSRAMQCVVVVAACWKHVAVCVAECCSVYSLNKYSDAFS